MYYSAAKSSSNDFVIVVASVCATFVVELKVCEKVPPIPSVGVAVVYANAVVLLPPPNVW